ncbi:wall-associated receptor kinase-like 20 [Bidens hawaiensis]|uniref:wall-associated receptor kinase-like 20 n=1 Tax=Bidens hawaiensis TaxID=980011 RepID=UPI004049A002
MIDGHLCILPCFFSSRLGGLTHLSHPEGTLSALLICDSDPETFKTDNQSCQEDLPFVTPEENSLGEGTPPLFSTWGITTEEENSLGDDTPLFFSTWAITPVEEENSLGEDTLPLVTAWDLSPEENKHDPPLVESNSDDAAHKAAANIEKRSKNTFSPKYHDDDDGTAYLQSFMLNWVPPPEPPCKTDACCDSTSTCKAASDGALRCFCKPRFHWDVTGQCASDLINSKPKRIIILATTMCIGVILLLSVHRVIGGKSVRIFTTKEIKKATNNFSSSGLLGVGGFGEVYKGVLDCGMEVAVKCAKLGNTKSVDQVLNEVRILGQVNHKNLIRLIGCCVEKQPLLVYEFIPNGSLFYHLHNKKQQPLTWSQRLGVAYDTTQGLAYLHFSVSRPIYHRDVKSSNILLDHNLKAKVADFGLSRLAHADLTHVTTCAQGTLGYLDPDYYWNYQLTDKSDVYSFGVLLLEMLTCQKAIDFCRPTDDVNLIACVKRIVNEERLVDVIDPMLMKHATSLDIDGMKAFGFLAMSCLEERRENRPSMKEVSEEIEYIMGVVDHRRDC